ncbi:MAG: hypothetical protein WA996_21110 [Candidatus Promineifilaceae bacterium]
MDTFISILVLVAVAVVVWVIAKFILKLTARVAGCAVTALIVVGLIAIVYWFFLR